MTLSSGSTRLIRSIYVGSKRGLVAVMMTLHLTCTTDADKDSSVLQSGMSSLMRYGIGIVCWLCLPGSLQKSPCLLADDATASISCIAP